MIDLYPFQRQVIAEAEQHQRPLIVAPTGSGKTVMASEMIRRAENKHVLFFAHRRELVFQPLATLAKFGVEAGVILSGESINRSARVQIASIQTLHARCIRGSDDLPPADIVFIDEAHHCPAQTYRSVIERYPEKQIVGMTATPCRREGRGLGSAFDAIVEAPQVGWLTKNGFLVPTKVYAPTEPDLRGVHTRHGDYVESELAERVDTPKLVGDIVTYWHRLNPERRKTVVFATSVGHSVHLAREFQKSGVRFEHIDGSTPKEVRDEILGRLSAGDLEGVTNCMVLTEGWDQPDVACAVLARPTKSMGLYRQMAGRVLRTCQGKDHALILDHAGSTKTHGFLHDEMCWTLDEDTKAHSPSQEARANGMGQGELLVCKECTSIRIAGKPCSECGYFPKRPGNFLDVIDGDLAHLERNGNQTAHVYSYEDKRLFHARLVWIARERGYKAGWAAHKYKEKFGGWPVDRTVIPIRPDAEVLAWDRHCRIRYAKSMEAKSRAVA